MNLVLRWYVFLDRNPRKVRADHSTCYLALHSSCVPSVQSWGLLGDVVSSFRHMQAGFLPMWARVKRKSNHADITSSWRWNVDETIKNLGSAFRKSFKCRVLPLDSQMVPELKQFSYFSSTNHPRAVPIICISTAKQFSRTRTTCFLQVPLQLLRSYPDFCQLS